MINSATKYCEREADDHPSVGRSQKISANAVMTQLPTGRVRKPGLTRGGSITATAFEDEVAAAWREMVSAISGSVDHHGRRRPHAYASAGSWRRTLIAGT
jgi:hypothetical protein